MKIIAVISTLCLITISNADLGDDPPCGVQHEQTFSCMMDAKFSDEVNYIMDKKKEIFGKCVPDYPKSCMIEWMAMENCTVELMMKAKAGDDLEFMAAKNQTVADITKCFENDPSNPLADLEMFFMPPMMKMSHHDKGKRGEKSGEKNSSGSGESEEKDGPEPPEGLRMRKECVKTPAQMTCIIKGLQVASLETGFAMALDSLVQKKAECEKKLKRSCLLTTPQLKKCFAEAHIPLFKYMMKKMETCLKEKGAAGGPPSMGSEPNKMGEADAGKKPESKEKTGTGMPTTGEPPKAGEAETGKKPESKEKHATP